MNVCVIYYSRTGTTKKVAGAVAERLDGDPVVARIRPVQPRSYPNWLLRSLVPGSTVEIQPIGVDLRNYDLVFVGSPKWSLGCPPLTRFVESRSLDGVPVAVFVTYGGFDHDRYLDGLAGGLERDGARVQASLALRRGLVWDGNIEDRVREFVDEAEEAGKKT